MKKFKITESDAKLLILLLSLLLISSSYFFVYKKNMEQIKVTQQENLEKQNTIATLQNMIPKEEEVRQKTALMLEKMEEIIHYFPSQVTIEKVIVILEQMEEKTGIRFHEIGFSMNQPMERFDLVMKGEVQSEEVVPTQDDAEVITQDIEDTNEESTDNLLLGFCSSISLNYEVSYDGLKQVVNEIYDYGDRMCISGLTAGFDSATGNLKGNITLDMYALSGTDQIYKDPNVIRGNKGSQNIFRSKGK